MNAVRMRALFVLAATLASTAALPTDPLIIWKLIGSPIGTETIKYSHSGNLVASSAGRVIKLWNPQTGAHVRTLFTETNGVGDLDFSPDDQYLLTSSADKFVSLWRVSDGQLMYSMLEGGQMNRMIRWVDNSRFLSSSGDRAVRMYRASDGVLLKTFPDVGDGPMDVMPGGSRFVAKKGIFGIDQEFNRMPLKGVGSGANVYYLKFSPNGRTVAAVVYDLGAWTLRTFHSTSGALIFSAPITVGAGQISFTPDSNTIITGEYGSGPTSLRLWSASNGAPLGSIGSFANYCAGGSVSPDGSSVAVADYAGKLPILRLSDGALIRNLSQVFDLFNYVDHTPDGSAFVTSGAELTLRSTLTGSAIRTFAGAFRRPTISRDGTLVASPHLWPQGAALYRLSDGALLRTFPNNYDVNTAAVSPDNSLVAVGCGYITWQEQEVVIDPFVRIFRVSDGQLVAAVQHASPVIYAEFSPDGSKLITGTRNGIQIHNTANWQYVAIPTTAQQMTMNFAGTLAATAQDNIVRVWDLQTNLLKYQFTSHQYKVNNLSFSSSGNILGASSFVDHDGPSEIRFWRMSDGAETLVIDGGIGTGISGFDVAPDGGSYLFSVKDVGLARAALP